MLQDAPPLKSPEVKKAIATDTDIKIQKVTPQTTIGPKDDEIWLNKATIACTQILECVKNGLTEEDGCILAGISLSDYAAIQQRAPQIVRMIEKEKVLYKLELMKPITKAIQSGDTSKAMWIAERKFPAEFGSSTKRIVTPPADNSNPISDIISRIQGGEGPGSEINKEINNIQHNED